MPATCKIYHRPSHIAIELYYRINGIDQAAGEVVLGPNKRPLLVAYNLQGDTEAAIVAMGEAMAMLALLYRAVVAWHTLADGRHTLVAFLDAQQGQGVVVTPERIRDMAKTGQRVLATA